MRLPGTRYQEPGWEQVRKLLGQCSLAALEALGPEALARSDPADSLAAYADATLAALYRCRHAARATAPGNADGDTVYALAQALLWELQARPADWHGLCHALQHEQAMRGACWWQAAAGQALLRKKVNDMYAQLRDRVDADNYQAACGRPCSANRMYAYRMLDSIRAEIARLLDDWAAHADEVADVLGRPVLAEPIEARQLRHGARCQGEWILRWSASRVRFGQGPGPLHTRSKRFAGLRHSPARIEAMLDEIAAYAALSAGAAPAWRHDAASALDWLDDYRRVLAASERADPDPTDAAAAWCGALAADEASYWPEQEAAGEAVLLAADGTAGAPLSPSPGYETAAGAAPAALLDAEAPGVRLAVYLKLLGPEDDSYPDDWRDPHTGALPALRQLAEREGISLPTLRKRRDAAIERLRALSS